MEVTLEHRYSGSADDVAAALVDQNLREAACVRGHARSHEVRVTDEADGTVVAITRVMPVDRAPDIAKKLVGDSATFSQTERWRPADANGVHSAEVRGEVSGAPVSIRGESRVSPDGTGSVRRTTLEIKVNVPLIGRRIEPFVAEAAEAGLAVEDELIDQRLG